MSDYPSAEQSLHSLVRAVDGLTRLLQAQNTYYPWGLLGAQAKAFDKTSVIATPVVNVETTVLTLDVPIGYDGIIERLANCYIGGSNPDVTQSLVWRIRIDQILVPNYNAITTQFGSPAQPRPTSGIFIGGQQHITYTVTNIDPALPAAGTFIFCCLAGHWWPRSTSY